MPQSDGLLHPMTSQGPDRALLPELWPRVVACALVGIAVFLTSYLAIWLTRELLDRVATIWLANAIVLGLIINLPPRRWTKFILAGFAGNIAANLVMGDHLVMALVLGLSNSIEIVLANTLLRMMTRRIDIETPSDVAKFLLVAGVVAPSVAAVFASAGLVILAGAPFWAVWLTWAPTDALGLIIVTPLLLFLRHPRAVNVSRSWSEIVLLPALNVLVAAGVFWQSSYPLLFVLMPPLVLIAFRLGAFMSIVAVIMTSVVAMGFTVLEHGPLQLIPGGLAHRTMVLQIFLAVATLLVLEISTVIMQRDRLKKQLRENLSVAESASEAKTEFLATMSHEIRTPLAGISGFVQLLQRRSDLPSSARRQIDLISQASSALLTVVNDILDFTKIEAGEIALVERPFALLPLIDNCVSIVRQTANEKKLDLKIDVFPNLPKYVLGDEARLRQIILNLLNNAIKFTDHGYVVIHARPVDGDRRRIAFSIKDTGIGIPKDKQGRLFERFSQVHSGAAREYGGTGLGLAICKRLVQLMDGTISVSSEPGSGATFSFNIKLEPTVGPTVQKIQERAEALPRRRGSLLLVDDLEINQEIAAAFLESAGHEVAIAGDGQTAIAFASASLFDVILMDIQMPGMDGIETAIRIWQLDRHARTPIVAMTANVLSSEVTRYTQLGFKAHLGKPYGPEELLELVDRLLPTGEAARNDKKEVGSRVELAALFGEEKLNILTSKLAENLRRFADQYEGSIIEPDHQLAAGDAHRLVSQAGLLGFAEVSQAMRELEEAARRGEPLEDAVALALRTTRHALACLQAA